VKNLNLLQIAGVLMLLIFPSGNLQSQGNTTKGTGLSFVRQNEPKEQAFTILVPKGWIADGGMFRIDAIQGGGPLNATEAKCNLTLKSNQTGSVYFRIFPDIVYAYPSIGGGFFPVGSNYQGAEIKALLDAPAYLKALFTYLHPEAVDVNILKINRLPGEKQSIDKGLTYLNQLLAQIGMQSMSYSSDAAGAVFEYKEQNILYNEVILAGIINMPAALTWKNTRTLIFRAPADEFEAWRPVMDIMRFSVQFNPEWVLKEAKGQRDRAEMAKKVYDEIQRIDREIAMKTSVNREEIMNDNFLVLTGQEEYVNPHTGKVETDTNAYQYRWETGGGDVYYTNSEDENPNHFLHQTDYKRTQVRKRRNE